MSKQHCWLCAVAMLLVGAVCGAQTQTAQWLEPVDGNWLDGARWSTGVYPNNGTPGAADAYDVLINAPGQPEDPYTVSLQPVRNVTVSSLTLDSAGAVLSQLDGGLIVQGLLDVRAGTYKNVQRGSAFSLTADRIRVLDTGAMKLICSPWPDYSLALNVNVLAGRLSFTGTVKLMSDVELDNGTLEIGQPGAWGRLKLGGDTTISGHGSLLLGTNDNRPNEVMDIGAHTLTLESGVTLRPAEGIYGDRTVKMNGGTLNNKGTIEAEWTSLGFSGGSVINSGLIQLTGGWLGFNELHNSGVVQMNDGRITLNSALSNTGVFRLLGGELEFGQNFTNSNTWTAEDLQAIQPEGGTVILSGTLDNSGRTLMLDGWFASVRREVRARVRYGTVAAAGEYELGEYLILQDINEFRGQIALGGMLQIRALQFNGDPGPATRLADGTRITMRGGAHLSLQADLQLQGEAEVIFEGPSNVVGVVHAPGLAIRTGDGSGEVYPLGRTEANLWVEAGGVATILAESGDSVAAHVTGGTLNLRNAYRAQVDDLDFQAGTVNLTGALFNTGQEIILNERTGPWHVKDGKIIGGTIGAISDDYWIHDPGAGATFEDVALGVNWTVPDGATLEVREGVRLLNRKITVASGEKSARLHFSGAAVVSGQGQIVLAGSAQAKSVLDAKYGTVTLGPDILVRTEGTGGEVKNFDNQGMMLTVGADRKLTLYGTWVNHGSILAVDSNLRLEGDWSNQGEIRAYNSLVEVGGGFNYAEMDAIALFGGTARISGTMDNTDHAFPLTRADRWELGGGSIKGGSVTAEAGQRLWVTGGILEDVLVEAPVAVVPGGRLTLRKNWKLLGGLDVDGGEVAFEGSFRLADLSPLTTRNAALTLQGILDNRDQTLDLDAIDGKWQLWSGGSISGGRIRGSADHPLEVRQSGAFNYFRGVTLSASVLVTGDGALAITNGLHLDAAYIKVTEAGRMFLGDTSVDGSGIIELSGSPTTTNDPWISAGRYASRFGPEVLLRSTAPLSEFLYGNFFCNEGTVVVESGSHLWFSNLGSGTLRNVGRVVVQNGGAVTIDHRNLWNNEGVIQITEGAAKIVSETWTNSPSGSVVGSGHLEVVRYVDKQYLPSLLVNEGVISPGASAGLLELTGSLTQAETGRLAIEIGGVGESAFDRLLVTGDVQLGGLLEVSLLGGFVPAAVDRFTILTGGSVTGVFANAAGGTVAFAGGSFDVVVEPTGVTLTNFQPVPEPGALGVLAAFVVGGWTRRR